MEKEKQQIEEEIPFKKTNLKAKDDLISYCSLQSFFLVFFLQLLVAFTSFYVGREFNYCEESLNFPEERVLGKLPRALIERKKKLWRTIQINSETGLLVVHQKNKKTKPKKKNDFWISTK